MQESKLYDHQKQEKTEAPGIEKILSVLQKTYRAQGGKIGL
jgi:hypothetical protein